MKHELWIIFVSYKQKNLMEKLLGVSFSHRDRSPQTRNYSLPGSSNPQLQGFPTLTLPNPFSSSSNKAFPPQKEFIYSFMGMGILLCCITFLGCIVVEAIKGCCMCFYTLLVTILILLEAALVGFIGIDHRWEKVSFRFFNRLLKRILTLVSGLVSLWLQY
ncbi:hypothetical protein UlMin_041642, partial [Ulmus minor]